MGCQISIITVAYNSGKTITKAIESVLDQVHPAYEYIIIDGDSTDDTVEVAHSYTEAFEKIGVKYKIVSEPDKGLYDAMNKGIGMATGDVVGMINSDDWYEPIALQAVSEAYEKEPFDLFYADIRIIKSSGDFIKHSRRDHWASTRHWNHPTTFIKKEVYNKFQYRCETIYDDWDLILRLRKDGCKIVILNEVLANFQFGGVSNEKSIKKMNERINIKYKIYRKNGYSRLYWFECVLLEVAKYVLS